MPAPGATPIVLQEDEIMKVIGIISSPHAEGNSATLVREALKGAEEAGASIQEVFLPDLRIEYCRDCRGCTNTGRCVLKDDFPALRDQLSEADGIILSSPTYASAACARMKNLGDRLGQFAWLTSTFGGKYLAGISTASSFGADKTAAQLVAGLRDGVFRRAYVSGTLGVALRGRKVSAMPQALSKAHTLGARVANDIRAGRRYPLQNLAGRLPNALLMRPMIRQAIVNNKEMMKGVYEELVRTGVVADSAA
jgi:multimeric flavodoxin WrbA